MKKYLAKLLILFLFMVLLGIISNKGDASIIQITNDSYQDADVSLYNGTIAWKGGTTDFSTR